MHNFYGYGDYRGAYWFVGMEEGGSDSFDEVAKRLRLWDERGRRELEDVVDLGADVIVPISLISPPDSADFLRQADCANDQRRCPPP
jgi:hypothetical protein